ncbi:PAS domain-containing protein [bacterium]|nr:PAS domain-containing protein [bacterium]
MTRLNTIQVISQKEAELLRLNRRVLDESPDLIAIVGKEYLYYYVNPAYVSIHKRTVNDFIGHHVREFLGEDIFTTVVGPNMEKCMNGEDVRYEAWFEFEQSGIYFMDVRYLPLHNTSGIVDRIVIITRNITFMKEAEQAKINHEKLQTIVQLAGTYNHEINNPLCSLSGYLELLKRDEQDAKKTEYIDKALEMVGRIADVTRKIEETTSIDLTDYPGGAKILNVSGNRK